MGFRDRGSGQVLDLQAGFQCSLALLLHGFALPRGEGRKKIIKGCVALVLPMELLTHTHQEALRFQSRGDFAFKKRHMDR